MALGVPSLRVDAVVLVVLTRRVKARNAVDVPTRERHRVVFLIHNGLVYPALEAGGLLGEHGDALGQLTHSLRADRTHLLVLGLGLAAADRLQGGNAHYQMFFELRLEVDEVDLKECLFEGSLQGL